MAPDYVCPVCAEKDERSRDQIYESGVYKEHPKSGRPMPFCPKCLSAFLEGNVPVMERPPRRRKGKPPPESATGTSAAVSHSVHIRERMDILKNEMDRRGAFLKQVREWEKNQKSPLDIDLSSLQKILDDAGIPE